MPWTIQQNTAASLQQKTVALRRAGILTQYYPGHVQYALCRLSTTSVIPEMNLNLRSLRADGRTWAAPPQSLPVIPPPGFDKLFPAAL
eukprot:1755260-Rhodomonas_salina.1